VDSEEKRKEIFKAFSKEEQSLDLSWVNSNITVTRKILENKLTDLKLKTKNTSYFDTS